MCGSCRGRAELTRSPLGRSGTGRDGTRREEPAGERGPAATWRRCSGGAQPGWRGEPGRPRAGTARGARGRARAREQPGTTAAAAALELTRVLMRRRGPAAARSWAAGTGTPGARQAWSAVRVAERIPPCPRPPDRRRRGSASKPGIPRRFQRKTDALAPLCGEGGGTGGKQ